MHQSHSTLSGQTTHDLLALLTVDELKSLFALLPSDQLPKRKLEWIVAIEEHLEGDRLRMLWNRLDEIQQWAVAEAVHSDDSRYRPERFKAKYGADPSFVAAKSAGSWRQAPSLLRLFLYRDPLEPGSYFVPCELAKRLRAFIPRPSAPVLKVLSDPPEQLEEASVDQNVPIVRRETERDALLELTVMLRLVDQGKLALSDKTSMPTASTVRDISAVLPAGDFYPAESKTSREGSAVGPIKAFAWPLLMMAGGLAEPHGRKLALSKAGREAIGKPPATVLRRLWQHWLKYRSYDEFNRIDVIKGQQGKGKRSMTAIVTRRAAIVRALGDCPDQGWVATEDFSRFMQASGNDFAITHDPWSLYIGDAQYGALGYAGFHDWHILQKRYLFCFLLEYAATLGLIDVAYAGPDQVPDDYGDLWGVDDLEFLSRYDGLLYFRLNALGRYCLGLSDDYRPGTPAARTTLAVLPSLAIAVRDGELSPEERLFLQLWAIEDSPASWRLDRSKIVHALESGQIIGNLLEFLNGRDPQGVPDPVQGFLGACETRAKALRLVGQAVLIECVDESTAEQLMLDKEAGRLCLRAGPRLLAVKVEHEQHFRQIARALGYGLASGGR